jgi:hypothetical protein
MAAVSGFAIMGEDPPLTTELKAFGQAIARGDPTEIATTRQTLLDTSNEHAVLDAAAVVGFFASITKIVDFSGHYSNELVVMLEKMAVVLDRARKTRWFLTAPFRWICSSFCRTHDSTVAKVATEN